MQMKINLKKKDYIDEMVEDIGVRNEGIIGENIY